MQRYRDRENAGKILANHLQAYTHQPNVIVLGLPRGGVPVAYQIAKSLSAPLDVFIVRKLGVPGHEELAMGAIAMGGDCIFNNDIIRDLTISEQAVKCVIEQEKKELHRREIAYRGNTDLPDVKNKIIILVDDGIATGATLRAAIQALRKLEPARIVLAVPVADIQIYNQFLMLVDELICPLKPADLFAVGAWYEAFPQTSDDEVRNLLKINKTE